MERKTYLTGKAFNLFLGASILTALSAMLGNIIDGIIVSHLIDYDAMSATSLSKPIIQGNYTFYQLMGLGASILVAKALGQNDHERANRLFSTTILILAAYSLIEMAIGAFCPQIIVNALCQNSELYDYSTQYFVPLLIGTPLFLAVYFLGGFTAIDGAPRLVSAAMIIDNVVNLCFDIILIKCFDMSVMGSSVATLIGHAVAIVIISSHYLRGKSQYHFVLFHKAQPSVSILIKESASTGLPFAVASICMTIYLYSTQTIIGSSLGKDGLFIFSVMLNIMTIYNMFVAGSCSTMQQLAALQLGMGDGFGHRMTVLTAFRFMNICLGTACAVMLFFPQLIADMFDCPESIMSECCYGVRIYGVAFWLFCNIYLLMVNYKLLHRSNIANFISLVLNLSVIPVMWVNAFHLPEMVWWSNLEAYFITFVFVIIYTIWQRRSDRTLMPIFLIPRHSENPSLDLSYDYTMDSMHNAFNEISVWLKKQQLTDEVIFRVRVACEELMSNVARHSHSQSRRAYVDVRLIVTPGTVTFALADDGTPFNPIENKDKGYGLMIANGIANDITYKYQFGQNMTTLKFSV